MSGPTPDVKSEAVIGDGYTNTFDDGSRSAGKVDINYKPPSFATRHPRIAEKLENARDFLTYFTGRKSPFTPDEKARIDEIKSRNGKTVGK